MVCFVPFLCLCYSKTYNLFVTSVILSYFEYFFTVNFFGMVRMVKAFLPILKEQAITKTYKGMRIINTVSMAGFVSGAPGLTGYSASKYAAQSFTESLRQELYPFHISVTSVNPSFHATPLITSLDVSSFDKLPQTIQVQYGKSKFSYFLFWKLVLASFCVFYLFMFKLKYTNFATKT